MSGKLSSSAQKIQEALEAHGVACQVVEMKETTRSAQEAADALGCRVGQIAKSLIFKGKQTNQPILVIASGPNRVNEKKVSQLVSEPLTKADADFVREHTGFSIGGVPPLGHHRTLTTFIDEDLLKFAAIWAAAGTPNAVFKLTPDELQKITNGRVITVK
ncbi:MAG: YbaK/EbsC family protein [Desulfobacterales bacterium]|nr:MAG: YbaK/EbsC family protein [Desulfobacterales bacterium]